MADDFVSLHTHTHASRFDGYGTEEAFVERLHELGQSTIAITEHGNLAALYDQHLACEKADIKLIPGIEAYLADDAERKGLTDEEKRVVRKRHPVKEEAKAILKAEEARRRDRDHITLWALTNEGLRNLFRLSSWSWNQGFYYRPRIDMKRLRQLAAGLAASTGCPGGVVTSPIRRGDLPQAHERLCELADIFGDRLYVEIMPHVIAERPTLHAEMAGLADAYGLKLLATQDAHYPRQADAAAQEVLLCIHTRDKMTNPPRSVAHPHGRFCFDSTHYWLRSRQEMVEAFAVVPGLTAPIVQQALDETMRLAERCEAKLQTAKPGSFLLAPPIPDPYRTVEEWTFALLEGGIAKRLNATADTLPEAYATRLRHELDRLLELHFLPYFLSVRDWIVWAKSQGIMVGPGRGSSAGCLVAWLLGITEVDPVLHGLSFDRFAPVGRKDYPDIDTDVQSSRREEVIGYLQDRYGSDRVALVGTLNRFGGKSCLRDVARVNGLSDEDTLPVTALITTAVEEESQSDTSLKDILDATAPGQRFRSQYPDIAEVATRLEGQIRAAGVHASGVVVSSISLSDLVPLESRPRKGRSRIPCIAFDMRGVEAMGLVKQDALGLESLSWIADCLRFLKERHGIDLDLTKLPLDDEATLQAFTDQRFTGVFQYDTPSSRRLCHGFIFRRFADVAALTALNRPGPMKAGLAEAYVKRSNDLSLIPEQHPIVARITKDTLGCLVYQEQVIAIARELAGYSPQEADQFRKKMAKKLGLSDEEERFIAGAMANGVDPGEAARIFHQVALYASYAFNASHSTAYAMLAFVTMALKVHAPAAFFAGALANEDQRHKQFRLAAEARRYGIPVAPPEVNASEERFSLRSLSDGRAEIVGSALDIKDVGPKASKAIASQRPYRDLIDFSRRASISSRVFQRLAVTTSLRALTPHVRIFAEHPQATWRALKAGYLPSPDPSLFPEYTERQLVEKASEVYPLFVSSTGVDAFDVFEQALRKATSRIFFLPGDPLLQDRPSFVFGRLGGVRVFEGEEKTGRMVLVNPDGSELVLRLPHDVLARSQRLLTPLGRHLLVMTTFYEGRGRAEFVADAEALLKAAPDALSQLLLRPPVTRPRDPYALVGQGGVAEGWILRLRKHRDRSGSLMATLGLLGSAGYVSILVFSSIWSETDVQRLTIGAQARLRLQPLDERALSAVRPPEIV